MLGSSTAKVQYDTSYPVWTGAKLAQGPSAADDDAGSENALKWASRLASALDADLILLHVEPRLQSPGEEYYSKEFHGRVVAEANGKMAKLQRAAGTQAQVVLQSGMVAHAVSKASEDLDAIC